MKRIFALLFICLLILGLFTACNGKSQKDTTPSDTNSLSSKEVAAWGNVSIEVETGSDSDIGMGSVVSDASSGTNDNSASSSAVSSTYDPSRENGFEAWVPVS